MELTLIYIIFVNTFNTHSQCVSTSKRHPNLNIGYSILQATLTLPLSIHTLIVYSLFEFSFNVSVIKTPHGFRVIRRAIFATQKSDS